MKKYLLLLIAIFSLISCENNKSTGVYHDTQKMCLNKVDKEIKIIYTSIEEALENPLRVYFLDLEREKIDALPPEIGSFINLKELK